MEVGNDWFLPIWRENEVVEGRTDESFQGGERILVGRCHGGESRWRDWKSREVYR